MPRSQKTHKLLFIFLVIFLQLKFTNNQCCVPEFVGLSPNIQNTYREIAYTPVTTAAGWTYSNGGQVAENTANTSPPSILLSRSISNGIRIQIRSGVQTSSDDDFFGFVLAFDAINSAGDITDSSGYLLIDWKQLDQSDIGCNAFAGLKLSLVVGTPAVNDFWCKQSSANGRVDLLQNAANYGSTGWADNQDYDINFLLTDQRLLIEVQPVGGSLSTEFDYTLDQLKANHPLNPVIQGWTSFPIGFFGFYQLSQPNARYQNYIPNYVAEGTYLCPANPVTFNGAFNSNGGCSSSTEIEDLVIDWNKNDVSPASYPAQDTVRMSVDDGILADFTFTDPTIVYGGLIVVTTAEFRGAVTNGIGSATISGVTCNLADCSAPGVIKTCGDSFTVTTDFTINVDVDTIDPTITCPSDMVVSTSSSISVSLPTVDDNCVLVTSDVAITNDQNGSDRANGIYPAGDTTVTYTATDLSGNTNDCSFTITNNYVLPLSCENDITISLSRSNDYYYTVTESDLLQSTVGLDMDSIVLTSNTGSLEFGIHDFIDEGVSVNLVVSDLTGVFSNSCDVDVNIQISDCDYFSSPPTGTNVRYYKPINFQWNSLGTSFVTGDLIDLYVADSADDNVLDIVTDRDANIGSYYFIGMHKIIPEEYRIMASVTTASNTKTFCATRLKVAVN